MNLRHEVTGLLLAWRSGRADAEDRLFSAVYDGHASAASLADERAATLLAVDDALSRLAERETELGS